MPRVPVVVCLIVSVLVTGCASGPRPASVPVDSPQAAASAGADARYLADRAGGPRPRWVQPDWWDDHPATRAAAWTMLGVGIGVVATVAVLAVIVAGVSKQIN